jgi:Uri superfamily endonuclease
MKGIYILIIKIDEDINVKIGSLGKMKFEKGVYAYVGSAQNNLEKRVSRHLSKHKKRFWHIDYLLDNKFTKIINTFYKEVGKEEECTTADELAKTEITILKFGSSDCKCKSHLFRIKNLQNISKIGMNRL